MKLIISNISDFKWRLHSRHFNPECTSKEVIEKISAFFNLLKDNYTSISSDKDTERYVLYFRAPKGKYEDDESYKYNFKSGDIEKAEYIKKNWDFNYPEKYKWFKLFFQHTYANGGHYYLFYLDDMQVFYLSDEKFDSFNSAEHMFLLKTAFQIVNSHITLCKNNKFGKMFDNTFKYEKRRGIIEYKEVWKIYPSLKRSYRMSLKGIDLNNIFKQADNDDITHFASLTSRKYYDICKIGYLALDNKIDKDIDSKKLFYKKADGRTRGLEDINIDSEKEFDEWFEESGKHPDHAFEILPGRSFYRGDLWIEKDDNGYYLTLSGSNYHTQIKILKIYNALLANGIKVRLSEKELFKSRIDGSAIFAIENEDNWCYGYTHVFDNYYLDSIHINDFPKLIPYVKWEDVKMSKYIDGLKI